MITGTNVTNVTNENKTDVDNNLNTFDTNRIDGSGIKRGVIMGHVGTPQQQPETQDNSTGVDETDVDLPEEADVTEEAAVETEDNPFSQQFEQTFGVKPTEARELVNSLQAFRDEQTLMRNWGTSPSEYDERMSQVRDFYNGLPEDGREQFNTVEGAIAIWNHLQTTGKAKEPTKVNTRAAGNTRVKRQQQKPAYDFTSKQIKQMPKEEYQRQLPAIVKAFQTGRVLDD